MHLSASTTRTGALAAAAFVALLAVACGDDDDSGSGDVTTSTVPGTDDPSTTTGADDSEATAPEGGSSAVTIAGFAFDPATLTVPAGTTVTWTNDDGVTHTTAAEDGAWDSGNLAPGDSFETVLDEPGTYTYSCGIHGSMQGEIVVE